MRKSILCIISIVVLLLVSGRHQLFADITQDEKDLNANLLRCDSATFTSKDSLIKRQIDYFRNNDLGELYKTCNSTGVVTTDDPNDNSKVHIILHYTMYQYQSGGAFGPGTYLPITDQTQDFLQTQLQTNGIQNYTYCSYTNRAQGLIQSISGHDAYARVTGLTFRAPGYDDKNYTITDNDSCSVQGGGAVGGDVLHKASAADTNTYVCEIKDAKPACHVVPPGGDPTDLTSGTYTSDLTKCNTGLSSDSQDYCGKMWYVKCGTDAPGQGLANCPNIQDRQCTEVQSESVGDGGGPFSTYTRCMAVGSQEQATPIATPTPTPPPPPCASKDLKDGCTKITSAFGTLQTDPQGFITRLFAIFLGLSGGIALLMIIRSGYTLMTSQGNAEKVKEAQDRITSAIVGLLFIVFSIVILEVIGVDLLHLPGLGH